MERFVILREVQAVFIWLVCAIAAYFDTTLTFLFALFLAFLFNIFAGFKADEVKFRMWRLVNFEGNKFKDSLKELCLIVIITYFLKGLMDLMHHDEKSVYAVQLLIWVALYFYVRNGLRNLSSAYPKVKFINVVYHLISFKFKELMPDSINKAVEKAEKKDNDETNK